MPQNLTPGQVIYLARKSKKMSQERLGKLIGLERSAIRDLEKGKKIHSRFSSFRRSTESFQ
ncbi:helix-turn-helix domain-containing protein [Microbulbifer okhotskensis]|uniref:helix-turn-helix domain-containing protein n=1 Tax=Microbulbifer okhotskensis TaxID=2926617 RepID=UPI00359C5EDD